MVYARCALLRSVPVVSALALAALAVPARADVTLNFGVYTSDKPVVMVRKFRPVLDALESSLSHSLGEPVRIKMQVGKTYEESFQQLVNGEVDFARFGPASYVMAKKTDAGISILAVESKKGKKVFYGLICVAEDSPIQRVGELKGKTFAFGDENSTIGRYLAQLYLMDHGVKVSDLSHYEYLGRHDRVGAAVALKEFDAGALKEGTFKRLVAKGMRLRAIASFPNVTKPWIARSGLPDRLVTALSTALLHMKDGAALKALKKDGFLDGSDQDYAVIREAIRRNAAFFN